MEYRWLVPYVWMSVVIIIIFIVQYRLQEDTRCLRVISLDNTYPPCCVALSPNGLVLSVAIHTSVWVYSSALGTLLYQFDNIHNG